MTAPGAGAGAPAPVRDRARLAAQLLCGPPAADVLGAVSRLLAVQAQDPRGARLAVRARTSGLRAADVDAALTVERSLVLTWLNRGTLHLVSSADYWALHALTTPQLVVGNARRLRQEGVDAAATERGVARIRDSLAASGPQTRGQLRERLQAAGVPVAGQALVHLLACSALRGDSIRGPMVAGEQAYVLVADWLGPRPAVDRDSALADLVRRYLAGHGPATDRDLAKWSGLALGEVRRGLRAVAGELDERRDGTVDLAGRPEPPAELPARLLGAFDALLHGWVDRTPVLDGFQGVVTSNGVFRPIALVDGRAVGTWRLARGRVEVAPFAPLDPLDAPAAAALAAEADDVLRFLS